MLQMSEIRDWDEATLKNKVAALRGELFKLKMEKKVSSLEKSHQLKGAKKDVARILTVLEAQKAKSENKQ